MKFFILSILVFFNLISLNSQSLSLYDIDTKNFPQIKAKFASWDQTGNLMTPEYFDIKLFENQVNLKIDSYQKASEINDVKVSSLLLFNFSKSSTNTNLDIIKQSADKIVDMLSKNSSECAVSFVDNQNYLVQDFSNNKGKISKALSNLEIGDYPTLNQMFDNNPSSILEIFKHAKNKKILVYVTDNYNSFENIDANLLDKLKSDSISVFPIIISNTCPEYLQKISLESNAKYFENITSQKDFTNAIFEIFSKIYYTSNQIAWTSNYSCTLDTKNIQLDWNQLSSKITTQYPIESKANLIITPNQIYFGPNMYSKDIDTTITLKANNSDIVIKNITSKNASTTFEIINQTYPFVLAKNTSVDIKLRYHSTTSQFAYENFVVESNLCDETISVYSGVLGSNQNFNTLKLIYPNNNEQIAYKSKVTIKWEGVGYNDQIRIEYSKDNKKTWNLISDSAYGFQYDWLNSDFDYNGKYYIRISQKLSNNLNSFTNPMLMKDITASRFIPLVNPYSNKIITSSMSIFEQHQKFYVIDLKTSEVLTTLEDAEKYFSGNSLWNSQGNVLVSCYMNLTFWDVNTGKILNKYYLSDRKIDKYDWTNDGTKFQIYSQGEFLTYDGKSGQYLPKITRQLINTDFKKISPNQSKYCEYISSTKQIVIKDSSNSIIKIIKENVKANPIMKWSNDSKKIAYSINVNEIYIVDLDSDNYQFKNTIKNNIVQIEWNYNDSKLVLLSEYKNGISVFDVQTATLFDELIPNNNQYSMYDLRCSKYEDIIFYITKNSPYENNSIVIYDLQLKNKRASYNSEYRDRFRYFWINQEKDICLFSNNKKYAVKTSTGELMYNCDISIAERISAGYGDYDTKQSSLELSPDESIFATNNPITIWDTKTIERKKIFTSEEYSLGISFNSDASQIASYNSDSSVSIWNVKNAQLINKIKIPTNDFASLYKGFAKIKWSPDNKKLALIRNDSIITVIYLDSSNLIKQLHTNSFGINDINWDELGSTLVSISYQGQIIIWDIENQKPLKTINVSNEILSKFEWSPDYSKFLCLNKNTKKLVIWDAKKITPLYTLSDSNVNVLNASWNPNGKIIATFGDDFQLKTWNVETGKLINSIKDVPLLTELTWSSSGENIIANNYVFDMISNKLIYTLHNNLAYPSSIWIKNTNSFITKENYDVFKFWSLNYGNVQQDTSLNPFTFIDPVVNLKEISIDSCLLGQSKIIKISDYMQNVTSVVCRIDTMYFEGNEAKNFDLVNVKFPFFIEAKASLPITIRANCMVENVMTTKLIVKTQSYSTESKISAKVTHPKINKLINLVDFGRVLYNQSKDSTNIILIRNESDSKIIVDKIRIEEPNQSDFQILSDTNSFTLEVGESKGLTIRFTPKYLARRSAKLVFRYQGMDSIQTVHLFGEGVIKDSLTSIEDQNDIIKSSLILYPNPVYNSTNLEFENAESSNFEIYLVNLQGDRISTLKSGYFEQGKHNISFDCPNISNGTYFLVLQNATQKEMIQMEILK